MNTLHGYLFFITFSSLLLFFAFRAKHKGESSLDDFLTAGRNNKFGLLSASILASWTWTLTLLGSAEAGLWFGISGGIHYAWGCIIPFVIFIPVAFRLRKILPEACTFSEFIKERFNKTLHFVFLAFGLGVSLYVFIQQLIGAGLLFENTFQIPFKLAVIGTGLVVAIYVSCCGLRGSLQTDLLQFFVIAAGCLILLPWLVIKVGGVDFIYSGLLDVVRNPENNNYNPEALDFFSGKGLRYGLSVVAVCMGQILFEQGYYQRAIAASNNKELSKAYLLGGVFAWCAIPISFGAIVGGVGLALDLGNGNGIESTSAVAPYVFNHVLGPLGGLIFATMTFMAATSTADTSLSGIQALISGDYYKSYEKGRTQNLLSIAKRTAFIFATIAILIAIVLEGKSLLLIDLFSGILFACPVAAFLFGLFGSRLNSKHAVISILTGLVSSILCWFLISDDELNWFVANICALLLPAIYILIFSYLKND